MKGLKTFPRGGIHPHDGKEFSNSKNLEIIPYSGNYFVAMGQHLGSPAKCLVEKGDSVLEGQKIGEASSFISAHVHSPVTGKVVKIGESFLPNGISSVTVEIEPDDASEPVVFKGSSVSDTEPADLVKIIQELGIVGLGGATFPTNVKLSLPKGAKAEYFIINGVECEPFLTGDHRLMVEETDTIINGLSVINKILNPAHTVIGIEINKKDAIEILTARSEELSVPFSVVPLKTKYPQGDEKQLIKAVTGLEVPSGKLPIDVGSVVVNIGTVKAIADAVLQGIPLIKRSVTISGSGIKEPKNLIARIGTPIQALIDHCGGLTGGTVKVVSGGPMMGFALPDLDIPVTKGTSGILVLTEKEYREKIRTSCLECGRCLKACPMGLSPSSLFKIIEHREYQSALENGLMDCKECGCCSYTCPAGIPLVQGMKLGKYHARQMRKK